MAFVPRFNASDEEAFPVFTPAELDAALSAGEACHFKPGESLFEAGDRHYDCFFIREGTVRIIDVSSDEEVEVVLHEAGHFAGDLDLLTGRPSVVTGIALTEVEAIRIPFTEFRGFLVRFPEPGDRLVRAFIRRRELLHEAGFEGIRIYGHKDCDMTLEIQEFFYRNGVPHSWMNPEEEDVRERLEAMEIGYEDLPLLTYGKTELFRKPSLQDLATHIGIQRQTTQETYDVTIIGAGPSGLGAAVYASSEGLKTLVVDNIGPGGQAGSSSKIENYAGFPAGLSGRELALRSYLQALKFGAEFLAPSSARSIRRRDDGLLEITICTGETIVTKTVVISTGISYRKLAVDGMRELQGSGVFYNATQVEAILCQQKPVHVIGAGNSAGQAAMFLSSFACEVHLLIRGTDIRKSMSEYLWSRVQGNPKIRIRYQTEMHAIEGDQTIAAIQVLNKESGEVTREETVGVFIFIGGVPCTDFLPEDIAMDERGFVLAGAEVAQHPTWNEDRLPCALETSCPGVFVSGDCRSGTTKRVAFAIGDGALAVTCVHEFLGTYQ